jgi:multidrug efflux pump subunit AcrA (membrane-fusion protein)
VKIGQNADIRIGNQRYAGKVSKIQQVAENDTAGKAKASIEISIDTDEELIVGLEADVVVEHEEALDVITVPNECIYYDDGGSFVYTVEEDEVKKTYVTSGVNDSEYTEVEGLEAGTHVVMDPSAAANLGEEIRESMVEDPQ